MAKKASAKSNTTKEHPEKLTASEIKDGKLVGEVREKTVEFIHNGKQYSIDILVKTLPYDTTDPLYKRWVDGEYVAPEWISKALVDSNGEQQFTEDEVRTKFVQPMATAIFDELWGAENIKKKQELEQSNKD